MYKLVLLRHGESEWNFQNKFTGWTDVGLTQNGIIEAKNAGKELKKRGFVFDYIFTSLLTRAINTMQICLEEMSFPNIEIKYSWRLNERHYGALQGLNKAETAKRYGNDQVLEWRRSFDTPPPPLELNNQSHPQFNKLYKKLKISKYPFSESLKDTITRFMPLWYNSISPKMKSGKKILIVAHGNSIRALIKYLDKINNEDIIKLNVPTGIPIVYNLNKELKPINNYFLGDQSIISKKVKKVEDQGKLN